MLFVKMLEIKVECVMINMCILKKAVQIVRENGKERK